MSGEQEPSLPISPHNHPLNPAGPTSEQRLQNNKTCTRWHVHTYIHPPIQTPTHTRSGQHWQITRQGKQVQRTRFHAHYQVILNVRPLRLKLTSFQVYVTISNSPAETRTHSVFILLTSNVKSGFLSTASVHHQGFHRLSRSQMTEVWLVSAGWHLLLNKIGLLLFYMSCFCTQILLPASSLCCIEVATIISEMHFWKTELVSSKSSTAVLQAGAGFIKPLFT